MNLITEIGSTNVGVELKYCERCGGLFLRFHGASLVFCAACTAHRAEFLSTTKGFGKRMTRARRNLRVPEIHGSTGLRSASIDYLHGVAIIEVQPC